MKTKFKIDDLVYYYSPADCAINQAKIIGICFSDDGKNHIYRLNRVI